MTEYSAVSFAYFFLAEYGMMIFMGVFITVLLFGFVIYKNDLVKYVDLMSYTILCHM